MNEEKIICADCGEEIEGDIYTLKDGRVVCEDCIDNYILCEECNEYVPDDEAEEVDGEYICADCLEDDDKFFKCSDCGEWHRRNGFYENWIETYSGDLICEDCYEENYRRCNGCEEIFPLDDLDDEEDDCGDTIYYCADCLRSRKKRNIKEYSYKPQPIFKTGTHDKFYSSKDIQELLFGVELEIDKGCDPEETAGELCEESEDIYCKHDGSLNDGIEIVTHPCTLSYHINELGWDKLCKIALDHDFRSNDTRTCGLHIHVGKYQLGSDTTERKETICKIILLVDRFWEYMIKFSRRTESQLNQWARRPNINMSQKRTLEDAMEDAWYERNEGRYRAVNLQNRETIEFRLFNGTLKVNTIYATLQLVSNICKYAKTHSTEEVMSAQWENVTSYEKYQELNRYLEERNLTSVENIQPCLFDKKKEREVIGFDADGTQLKKGDRVIIINADGSGVRNLAYNIGKTATVICKYRGSDTRSYEIGIRFAQESDLLHNLNGEIDTESGYWVYSINIRKI